MSASAFSRIRRKSVPLYKSGNLTMGYYNTWNTNTNSWAPNVLNTQVFTGFSNVKFDEAQITMDNKHPGPPYRTGGAFRTLKLKWCTPSWGVFGKGSYVRNDGLWRYVGGFAPPKDVDFLGNSDFSDLNIALIQNSSHFPDMSGWGDKAWAKAKPPLEQADGFVFLREAKDIPRMMKTTSQGFHDIWKTMGGNQSSRIMEPKKLADHFLNHQFGWKPFLSDLRKFDNIIQNSTQIISRLADNNGQWKRRRVTLKNGTSEQLLASGTGVKLSPGLAIDYFTETPRWELVETIDTHVYAVGKFRYYIPAFDRNSGDYLKPWNAAMRVITVSGLRPSPSNIYKSIPWSWAADWISNIGQHVDYYSDILTDTLACEYFFVMMTMTKTRRFRQILPFIGGQKVLEFDRVIETKQRQEGAGPYGFSVTWDQLTPRQLAITAALGISRK